MRSDFTPLQLGLITLAVGLFSITIGYLLAVAATWLVILGFGLDANPWVAGLGTLGIVYLSKIILK